MAISERLALLVTLDAKGAIKSFNDLGNAADKNLGKADQKLDKMASRFQKAGAGMLATAGIASVGLYKAAQSAADLEQAVGGTEAVFGDASEAIDTYAKKASKAAGLSESAFRQATTSIGGQLKGLGFTTSQAADQAIELTQVAADLAATYGGTTAEAVQALGAALRGEADPAERFNLFLNQTRVNAKAVELGLADTTSEVDANAKAQAVLALVTEQSADAQGQFAREAGTAAGQMQIANAEFENAKASLGQVVAPVLADVAGGLADVAGGFTRANEASGGFLSKAAAVGTAGLALGGALTFTVGKVIDMRDTLAPLGGRLRDVDGGFTRLGKSLAGLGLAGAVVGFVQMARSAEKLHFDVDDLAAGIANLSSTQEAAAGKQLLFLDSWGQLDELISRTADTNVIAAERLVQLAEAAGLPADRISELGDIVDAKRESDVQGAKDQQEYAAQVDAAVGPVDDLTGAVEEQKTALDLAAESANLFKEGLAEAFGDLTLEEAADRRAQAFSDMAARFSDAQQNVKDAKQRVADLLAIDVDDRSDTFARDLAAAQQDVRDAIDETSRTLEGNSEAALQNREDIRGVVDDIAAVIQAHRDEGASLEDLQIIRMAEKANLVKQLEQLGFNREEIGKYIEAIDAIPLTAETTMTVNTAAAKLRIEELRGLIQGLAADADANGVELAKFSARNPGVYERRAIGGPVTAGERYSVNEYLGAGKGFEWFAPANGTMSPAGSATGGAVIEQTNNFYNPTPEPASTSAKKLRHVAMDLVG